MPIKERSSKNCEDLSGGYAVHTYLKEGSSIILISRLARLRTELIYSQKGVKHLYAFNTSRQISILEVFHISNRPEDDLAFPYQCSRSRDIADI